jgi:neutral trehalase
MVDTAKGIVESLLALVEQYGFMPNGGRMYYENRRFCANFCPETHIIIVNFL